MDKAIRCHELIKHYPGSPPTEAVSRLSVDVIQGECFGLLGPNGAGKTTTIEILEGILAPTSGEVEILGLRWGKSDDEIRQKIGISLQDTKLAEKLTVHETLRLFRSFYRSGHSPERVMKMVSLEEKTDSYVEKLSGGQRQRLAVATALIGRPNLLFLDEPTTGLDPSSRRQIWSIVHEFRLTGGTLLLTTHYMDEAERLCDRVAIVDKGKIIALGTPRELIQRLGGEHMIDFDLDIDSNGKEQLIERLAKDLGNLPSVLSVHAMKNQLTLAVKEPHLVLPQVFERINREQLRLYNLSTRHASLEDVFVRLTGRRLVEEVGSNHA